MAQSCSPSWCRTGSGPLKPQGGVPSPGFCSVSLDTPCQQAWWGRQAEGVLEQPQRPPSPGRGQQGGGKEGEGPKGCTWTPTASFLHSLDPVLTQTLGGMGSSHQRGVTVTNREPRSAMRPLLTPCGPGSTAVWLAPGGRGDTAWKGRSEASHGADGSGGQQHSTTSSHHVAGGPRRPLGEEKVSVYAETSTETPGDQSNR